MIIVSVIAVNTLKGDAPRSMAASSMDTSISIRREVITTATKAAQKVTWAIHNVFIPRPAADYPEFSETRGRLPSGSHPAW